MTDIFTKEKRSWVMSRIKSESHLESKFASLLRKSKISFERHPKILGRPDFRIRDKKTVIFIDGCFWHMCPKHYVEPKSKRYFWERKIKENTTRDRKVNKKLRIEGYKVIRIWEHDIKKDPENVLRKIIKYIR
jgi:DNA mismatch endonuclease (patch repair protein)